MLLFMERKGAPKGEPGGFAEMKKFAGELASQGKLRRGAPLVAESAGARVRVRDGRAFVSDGPFAESKEIVGGFWIIEAASREEAIEIARRCPMRATESSRCTSCSGGTPPPIRGKGPRS